MKCVKMHKTTVLVQDKEQRNNREKLNNICNNLLLAKYLNI